MFYSVCICSKTGHTLFLQVRAILTTICIWFHNFILPNLNRLIYLWRLHIFLILYGKGFLKVCMPPKMSNEIKCTNERMTWNTQDTNLSWYMPKANVDHTISGQGTAISNLDHSTTTLRVYIMENISFTHTQIMTSFHSLKFAPIPVRESTNHVIFLFELGSFSIIVR